MSERQVGFYSPEQVADGWLAYALGKCKVYKLDSLARPSPQGTLDLDGIMYRHVEKFWRQYEVYAVREKWLRGRRRGRAWNRFKKWYTEAPLVLIPRVELDNTETVVQEVLLGDLCKEAGIPVDRAINAIKYEHLSAWKPANSGYMTHRATFNAWAELYRSRMRGPRK